jgi:uncharacterized protein (DUF2235 family)
MQKEYEDAGNGSGPARFKHIIIGIDGTWQAAFRDPFQSNVHRMNIALDFHDNTDYQNPQIYIYSAGIGTANHSSRAIAGALGEGLDELVLSAYINLASNYVSGDRIYIFGFSRGAIAARALASFISHSGLLKANSLSFTAHAWRYFTREETDFSFAAARSNANDVEIEFLGVWDSVPGPYKLEDLRKRYRFEHLRLSRNVKFGAHILAMDETRKAFSPLLWEGCSTGGQTLEQVWLPGVHGDIGGGYGSAFISTVSLLLMIEILAHRCPTVKFDTRYIEDTLLPIVDTEDVVINNEWHRYPGRFFKYFSRGFRSVDEKPEHFHFQHPLTNFISGKEVTMRSSSKKYTSGFRVENDAKCLGDAAYIRVTDHSKRLEQILKRRFPK